MLKIGITGNIGSGKSTVCKLFELYEVPIYYADKEAKQIMIENKKVKSQIQDTFGKDIYLEGTLNTKALASRVFGDEKALKILSDIVHPVVRNDLEEWFTIQEQKNHPMAIEEAALIFEAGQADKFDKIITVIVPKREALKRASNRDQSDIDEIEKRWNNQMDQSLKAEKSDGIILNDGQHSLILQVQNLINRWKIQWT